MIFKAVQTPTVSFREATYDNNVESTKKNPLLKKRWNESSGCEWYESTITQVNHFNLSPFTHLLVYGYKVHVRLLRRKQKQQSIPCEVTKVTYQK